MVWSNDLAKLKQSLKADEGKAAQPPAPPPRPQPPPARKSLEEEDAVFLAAMGKASAAAPAAGGPAAGFGEAMRGLGGVRPVSSADSVDSVDSVDSTESGGAPGGSARADHPGAQKTPPPPSDGAASAHPAAAQRAHAAHRTGAAARLALLGAVSAAKAARAKAASAPARADGLPPERIQLAAGMTIDVDCVLDLRKHNEADAGERLKERVLDGVCLGWRTMQVVLGGSEPLRQVLLDYVASPAAHPLANYGEAPVPMGGRQAWVLYFCQAPTQDLDQ